MKLIIKFSWKQFCNHVDMWPQFSHIHVYLMSIFSSCYWCGEYCYIHRISLSSIDVFLHISIYRFLLTMCKGLPFSMRSRASTKRVKEFLRKLKDILYHPKILNISSWKLLIINVIHDENNANDTLVSPPFKFGLMDVISFIVWI